MITKEDIINDLHQVIRAQPGRTNEGLCRLTLDGETPNCIVAQVLAKRFPDKFKEWAKSLTPTQLDANNWSVADNPNSETWSEVDENDGLLWEMKAEFDGEAADFLAELQTEADNGGDGNVPWAEALEAVR